MLSKTNVLPVIKITLFFWSTDSHLKVFFYRIKLDFLKSVFLQLRSPEILGDLQIHSLGSI